MTTDEIRARMVAQFELCKPGIAAYQDYAERMSALSLEYHKAKLKEVFPSAEFVEAPVILSLNVCQTPKSLDAALEKLADNVAIKRVIFDPLHTVFHLLA